MLFGYLLFTSSFTSLASNIDHVNIGRIAVDDQSVESQQKAGELALQQVFVKLSGNIEVIKEPEISRAIDNYEQFLTASSFIQQGQSLVFEATFNQAKVENLLLASGLSVWASLRPSAVVWLALENSNKQKVVFSQYSNSEVAQKVSLKAFARGVEVVTPLGDLQDTINVSVYDVWNQFISKLQDQSVRYNTDYLISATVQPYNQASAILYKNDSAQFFNTQTQSPLDDQTDSETDLSAIDDPQAATDVYVDENQQQRLNKPREQRLLANIPIPQGTTHKLDYIITYVDFTRSKKVETGRLFGESEYGVILALVDVYANMLAKEFALNTQSQTPSQSIKATVSGIDSLEDYVNMIALIKSIPSVENVRLIKQLNDVALIEVDQKISITQLKSILLLDNRLSYDSRSELAAVSFRWQGE
ncbi:MAG: hypothetical protein ACJAVV_000423 [Alphaproteobacteria bacterium]|jgi:hypothetical protein